MQAQYDAYKRRQAQNPEYWRAWARRRGVHYYSVREPWESAEGCAPCVSDEPDLQRAFVEGWRTAEMGDHA